MVTCVKNVVYTVFVQVMENLECHGIEEFHFPAWKVIKFNCWSLKVLENESCVGRLITADGKARKS